MKIISHRKTETVVGYFHSFEWEDMPGAGFYFDCDKDGVKPETLNECSRKNYEACIAGEREVIRDQKFTTSVDSHGETVYAPIEGTGTKLTVKIIDLGIQRTEHSYTTPAVGKCECGTHVDLDGFTNTCDRCGRDYNMSGQLLAPRAQWGEETGESVSDILAVDRADDVERLFEE